MNIQPVGAELFHADGRTDKTKEIVAFRKDANAPKNTHTFFFVLSLCGLKQYKTRYEVQVKSKWIFLFGGRLRLFRKRLRVAMCGGKTRLD